MAVAHVDVMDGCFCPMMTVGPPIVRAMKTPMVKDVHLMIDEPLSKVGDFVAAGADIVTVHVESSAHVHRVLQQLGTMANANDPARGIVRGIALNPGTPVEAIEPPARRGGAGAAPGRQPRLGRPALHPEPRSSGWRA